MFQVIKSAARLIPMTEAPISVATDFPSLVRQNKQIINDCLFLISKRGPANAAEIANIIIDDRRASSPTLLRHDFHLPAAVESAAWVVGRIGPIDTNDLCRSLAYEPVYKNERLAVLYPARSRFVDKLLRRIGFCESDQKAFQLHVLFR